MEKRFRGEVVLNVLKDWGYSEGEFEEIAQKLARWPKCVYIAEALHYGEEEGRPRIGYFLELSRRGVKLYKAWCKRHDRQSMLAGKLENILIFVDDSNGSVEESLKMLESSDIR